MSNNHLIKNAKKLYSLTALLLFFSLQAEAIGRQMRRGKITHTFTHTHIHFLKKKEENIQSCLVHTYMRNRNLGRMHLSKQENQVGND